MRINPVNVVVWVLPTHQSFACFVSFVLYFGGEISHLIPTAIFMVAFSGRDTARLLLIVLASRQKKFTNSKTKPNSNMSIN